MNRPLTRTDFEFGHALFDAADTVRLGNRIVPRAITVHVTAPALPEITLTIETAEDTRPRCTGVTVHGDDVRHTHLRAIKVTDWIDAVVATVSQVVVADDDGRPVITGPAAGDASARNVAMAAIRAARGPRTRLNPDHLRRVGQVYTANPGRGLLAVQEAFGAPRTTAARWVRAARQQGHIPGDDKGNRRGR